MEKEFSVEDIDIFTLLRDILFNLWAIVLGGAVVAMLAVSYVRYTYVPEYRSQVTFVVSTKDATSSMYANLSTTIEMANIFTQIMDSDILKEKASQIAGYDELPGKIDAYAIPETNLLVVGVTAKNPEDAFKTLKLIIENYRLVSDYIYGNAHLEVIEDIEMSGWPVNSMDESRIKKLSFAAGAFLSTCAVCALSYFRDTVKNEKQANSKLGTKLLSTIRHEKKYKTIRQIIKRAKRTPLVTDMFASFDFVCSYKKLCMKIENSCQRMGLKSILVTSVNENEGKSTVCANIALTLAENNHKVLLLDADLKKPALYKILGKKDAGSFRDFIQGKKPKVDERSNVWLMLNKESYKDSAEILASKDFQNLLDGYAKEMDFVIIDTPPLSAVSDGEILANITDASILVVKQDFARVGEINDANDRLEQSKCHLLGVVLNNLKGFPFINSLKNNMYKSYYYRRVPLYKKKDDTKEVRHG